MTSSNKKYEPTPATPTTPSLGVPGVAGVGKSLISYPYKDCRFRKHFQTRHYGEADYKNFDADFWNSDH